MNKIPDDFVRGSIHKTNNSGLVTVLNYISSVKVEVQYEDGTKAFVRAKELRNGNIKNPSENAKYPNVSNIVLGYNKHVKALNNRLRVEFTKELYELFPSIEIIKFNGKSKSVSYSCNVCGNRWNNVNCFLILKSKHGCPKCADYKSGQLHRLGKDRLLEIQKLAEVKFLEKYENSDTPIKVKCVKCNRIWKPLIGNLVRSGPCRCDKNVSGKATEFITHSGFLFKYAKLGNRTVTVQGSEHLALEYLVETKKISPKRIRVSSEGGVPIINYKYAKITHRYYPDILIDDNTIVEVKSPYTLFKTLQVNKRKAKACIDQGYEFILLVSVNDKIIKMPKSWFTECASMLQGIILQKTIRCANILSIDPGTTNAAWSILRMSRSEKGSKILRVVASGKILTPIIDTIGEDTEPLKRFIEEMDFLINSNNINIISIERFVSRGLKGKTIELVNRMIGIIHGIAIDSDKPRLFFDIMPAHWKNEWNKYSSLEEFYKKVNCVVHQVDAVGIGLYAGYKILGYKPFYDIKDREQKLAKEINQTNLGHSIQGRKIEE